MVDISKIPSNPGCYLHKDKKGKIIYVGKAKNLKKRVASYFSKVHPDEKTRQLVKNIEDVDFIVTDNEIEAMILENTLIKKNKPKYNINLKDSKGFSYIHVTEEEYPRVLVARKKLKSGKLFGPFVSGSERKYIMKFLKRVFQIRTCRKFPKRACLRHHIGLCLAPCVNPDVKEQYLKEIDKVIRTLKGDTEKLTLSLEDEMKRHSENAEFEKAMVLRDQINALSHLAERQKMQREKRYDEDIINYIVQDEKVFLLLFNIYRGTLANKQEFSFDYSTDFLEEFLVQYYSDSKVPKEVILPENVEPSIERFLEKKRGSKVQVTVPKIGEKQKLLLLVQKNLEISFFGDLTKMEELRKKLNLQEIPRVIECFDISHISGTSTVGSMVQFRMGKPDKSNYRRFRIRTVEGIDDFAAISEVVRRRYSRLLAENSEMPDLVIIDGGRGQLNAALAELEKLSLRIPVIGIAKKLEEIYVPGLKRPMRWKKHVALRFIQEIRDEAHRFAIKYNRLLRKKKQIDENLRS
jgi:excinuclease ABC subunit C